MPFACHDDFFLFFRRKDFERDTRERWKIRDVEKKKYNSNYTLTNNFKMIIECIIIYLMSFIINITIASASI